MKNLFVTIACLFATVILAAARDPWVTQTGLTSSQLASRVLTFGEPALGLQIEEVSGYEESGVTHYAARWGPKTDTYYRRLYSGMTAAGFVSTHASIQAAGWRICYMNGFQSGGTDYYNAVYRKSSGVPQILRVGDTLNSHQSADDDLSDDGYYLENLTAFQSGTNVRYAAVWNQSIFFPVTEVSYGLTGAQLITEVNDRINTWRIHAIAGYTAPFVLGGGDARRFTVMWRTPKLPTVWAFFAGLSKDNYFAADSNQIGIGWQPSFLQVWENGNGVAVNAMWIPNGGLGRTWTNQIDSLVGDAMTAGSIPALSLAISRNGRLVFKRAYGYADQEAGLWAGTDHRFRIASVSKAITGVSVLRALEQNLTWNWQSKAFGTGAVFGNDYGTPPYSTREKDITISNLLHHTAGWADDGKLWWQDEPAWGSSHQEFIDWQLDHGAFVADPGDIGRYSNLGFTIAARVVEKLSGDSYETYTKNKIFAPCGIATILGPQVGERTRAQKKFMEVAYYPDPVNTGDPYLIDPRRMDGSTAWIARPADLLLFSRRVDGDDDFEDIISPVTLTRLHTRETPASSTGYNWETYGCGWYTDNYANPGYWGHNGSMNGTRAELVSRTNGISYSWAANARQGISNSALESIINSITTANAWPDINLFGVHHPGYDAWLDSQFSSILRGQRGLDELLFEPSADPDCDGIPNAAEYVLGTDPEVANKSPYYISIVSGKLRVRWLVKNDIEGATISYRASTDLEHWTGIFGVSIQNPGGIVPTGYSWRQLDIPMSGPRRFVKIAYQVR